jgi:spoIIIJ-associated protein
MEFTARTVEEAVKKGLAELNATEEQVDVEIKEQPTKGIFGIMMGKAVVEITLKQVNETKNSNEEKAVDLVKQVLKYLGIDATATLGEKDEKTVITLSAEDSANLIGYRGEVLDALQTLAGAMANVGNKVYKKVVVDCENYRDKREDTLIRLAHKLEAKATELRREVILEPMSAFERRIIHTALANSETVTTRSEGKEPNRYVVIVPNDKDEFSKPYNAGRNSDRGGRRDDRRNNSRGGNRNNGRSFNKGRGGKSNSSSGEIKKKTPSLFGTFLGNSLKDKE